MIAKDIFSFATVTDGCDNANFMGFTIMYIYENELTSENMYLPMILARKSQFHFSFFKVDSQNPKFSLEYLWIGPLRSFFYEPHPTNIIYELDFFLQQNNHCMSFSWLDWSRPREGSNNWTWLLYSPHRGSIKCWTEAEIGLTSLIPSLLRSLSPRIHILVSI